MTGRILAANLSDLEHHQNPTVLYAFKHFGAKKNTFLKNLKMKETYSSTHTRCRRAAA